MTVITRGERIIRAAVAVCLGLLAAGLATAGALPGAIAGAVAAVIVGIMAVTDRCASGACAVSADEDAKEQKTASGTAATAARPTHEQEHTHV